MASTNQAFAQLAARQGGVVRRDQLLELGLTSSAISRRLQAGELRKLANGVYRVYEPGDRLETLRGALAALPGSVVSHESAAMLHNIAGFSHGRCSVTVPRSATHRFPGVIVHRTDDLLTGHVGRLSGCSVTNLERTVFDLASRVGALALAQIVDDLVIGGRTSIARLETVLLDVGRRGRVGTSVMRELVESRQVGTDPDATPLERLGLAALSVEGISGYETQYSPAFAPTWRFDVAFPERRLAIEWDSRRWHTRVDDFDRDRQRDRVAATNGWVVIRFTMEDVKDRPDEVAEQVVKALAARSAA